MSSHGAATGPRPMARGFTGGCTIVKVEAAARHWSEGKADGARARAARA